MNAEDDNGHEIHGTKVPKEQFESQIPGKEDTIQEDNWIFVSWVLVPDISFMVLRKRGQPEPHGVQRMYFDGGTNH